MIDPMPETLRAKLVRNGLDPNDVTEWRHDEEAQRWLVRFSPNADQVLMTIEVGDKGRMHGCRVQL